MRPSGDSRAMVESMPLTDVGQRIMALRWPVVGSKKVAPRGPSWGSSCVETTR
jgi:hypothetical protein